MNVVWPRPAAKALADLPPDAARRIRAAVERYAETGHGDVRRLQGQSAPEYRLRVGDYRVRFKLDAGDVLVLGVLHRGEAYR